MRLAQVALFSIAALPAIFAFPANNQLRLGKAGQTALNWGAGAISSVGDGGAHTATRWDYYDCGEPTDIVQLKSIRLSPDPPKPGHNLTIYATGSTSELIDEGAYADVVVKLGLIKLLTKRFDVCEELDNANATLQCPIAPDDYSIKQVVELPAEIPRAKFLIQARAFSVNDDPLLCLDLSINFLVPDAPHDSV